MAVVTLAGVPWRNSSSKEASRSRASSPSPATRTRPCRSSPPACSPRRSCSCTGCRGSATPRPRSRCSSGSGSRPTWVADNSLRLCAASVSEVAVDEELSAKIRASFLLAGPLLARFGEARMPPPGGDFIGRRRLDAHLDAFVDLGARIEGDRWIELSREAGRPAGLRDLHGRALGDGHRERADGGGADAGADDDLQRRLRAARPGPGAAAGEDGRRGRRDRLQRDDRPRPRPPRRRRAHDLRRPHRGRQLHGARRRDRGRAADPRRRARRPRQRPPPVRPPRADLGDRRATT